jgi:hypothetical protein
VGQLWGRGIVVCGGKGAPTSAFWRIQDLAAVGIVAPNDVQKMMLSLATVDAIPLTAETTVLHWLHSLNLSSYVPNFAAAGVATMPQVTQLWEDEIISALHVDVIGHRQRIRRSLEFLRKGQPPAVLVSVWCGGLLNTFFCLFCLLLYFNVAHCTCW